MAAWKRRDTPPHPDWVSSRSVQCSGESFGFMTETNAEFSFVDRDVNDVSSSESIMEDAECAADELNDLCEGEDEVEANIACNLPASSQWMALLHGKYRPFGKVIGNVEWEYFKSNLSQFQGRDEYETDNYSSFRWSAFAESWNKWVDTLGAKHPEVTYKTASYLKHAYKIMQKNALQSSTIRSHAQSLDKLRHKHTNRDTNMSFADEFPPSEKAAAICQQPTTAVATAEDNAHESDSILCSSEYEAVYVSKKKRKKEIKHRCRRCGKYYALPEWRPYHENRIQQEGLGNQRLGLHLHNGDGNKVWDNCTVNPADFEDGFPCMDLNKRLPRDRRKRPV